MSDNFFDFDEFDEQFDSESLKKDLAEAESGNAERKEVPHGIYEVKITKLELTKSKTSGQPMVSCWFKVVAGDMKGQMIFMNQVLKTGFGLHKCNEFLRSITSLPVTFESFKQYNMLLMDIMEETDGKREYQLNYAKDAKGYNTFKIEKIFSVSGNDDVPF